MATNYPTSKQTFTNPTSTSDTNVVDHAGMHANTNDTLGALQDTVGYSADTATSVLGRLSPITGSDVAVGKSATQTLINKTLIAPIVNGTSGNLTISASTDGGEYNLNASVSGTLAVYGAGGQTLHLNLLDGNLQTNSTTRLTNAGVLQNVSIDGGSNTITNVGTNQLSTSALYLGSAQITSNFSTASTIAVQVTGLTITVTAPTSRRIKLTVSGYGVSNNTGGDGFEVQIWDGTVGSGTRIASSAGTSSSAGGNHTVCIVAIVGPVAGSKTYNVGLQAVTGGTATLSAAGTAPVTFLAEAL